MADRSDEHPWGTCDGCGVDLGGVCCYSPHQYGEYDQLCHECFSRMKREAEMARMKVQQANERGASSGSPPKR